MCDYRLMQVFCQLFARQTYSLPSGCVHISWAGVCVCVCACIFRLVFMTGNGVCKTQLLMNCATSDYYTTNHPHIITPLNANSGPFCACTRACVRDQKKTKMPECCCYLHIYYVHSALPTCVYIMNEWAHVGVCEQGSPVSLVSSFLSEIKVKWVIYHEDMWLGHFSLVCACARVC